MRHLLFLLIIIATVNAKEPRAKVLREGNYFTVGYKVGTLGAGLDTSYAINNTFAIRASLNGLSGFKHITINEKEFATYGLLMNNGLLLDIHPWQNAFFFSWGAYYSKSQIKLTNKPKSGEIVVGEHKYPAMQVGNVTTLINLKHNINPYFGIGFNSRDFSNKWHFTLDVGAVYVGTPNGNIQATASDGFKALQPVLDKESDIENKKLNTSLKKIKFYPVVSVGIAFKY